MIHQLDDADWLADVGFGDSFRQPLRLESGLEQQDRDGRWYRLLKAHEESKQATESG